MKCIDVGKFRDECHVTPGTSVNRSGVPSASGLASPDVATHRQGHPDEPLAAGFQPPDYAGAAQGGSGYPDPAGGSGYPDSPLGYPAALRPDRLEPDPPSVSPPGPPPDGEGYGERRYAEPVPRYPDGGRPGYPDRPAPPSGPPPGPQSGPPASAPPAASRPGGRPGYPDDDLRLNPADLTGGGPAAPGGGPIDPPTAAYPAASQGPQPAPPAGPQLGGLPPSGGQPGPQQGGPAGGPAAALSELLQDPTNPTEPVQAYRGPASEPTGVYQSAGRPQLVIGLAVVTVLFEIPVAVLLVRSLIGPAILVPGLVSGLFLLPGLPLFSAGLYGLFAGRIMARPGEGLAAVVRRPFALLLVGALLLLCAALAAG